MTSPDIASIFAIIYEREATTGDLKLLADRGVRLEASMLKTMRNIIGAMDRQTYATPISIRFSKEDVRFHKIEDFDISTDNADVAVGAHMAWAGNYEPHVCSLLRKLIRPGMTVIDAGANIGFYSLLASQLVGETGRVLAFEPNSENCRLIALSIQRNQRSNITIFPFGLAEQQGASFFSPAIGSNGGLLSPQEETVLNLNCTVIPVFGLDEIHTKKVDFIKIDTEGAEGLIVRGAQRTIEKHRPIMSTEFAPEMLERVSRMRASDYLSFFENKNYALHVIDNGAAPVRMPSTEIMERHSQPGRIDDLLLTPVEKLERQMI